MPVPINQERTEDPRERWLDDLLAADREHLRETTEKQIAGGMCRRILQARAERGHRTSLLGRWAIASAGVAIVIFTVWIAIPRKITHPPVVAGVVQPAPSPTTAASVHAPVASNTRPTMTRRSPPGAMRVKAALRPKQTATPRQAVFPSNIVPTDEERLLMELASNHPEKLAEITQLIVDDTKQEKERARAFEEWLRQGEKQ